jgi:hypothetical protein
VIWGNGGMGCWDNGKNDIAWLHGCMIAWMSLVL